MIALKLYIPIHNKIDLRLEAWKGTVRYIFGALKLVNCTSTHERVLNLDSFIFIYTHWPSCQREIKHTDYLVLRLKQEVYRYALVASDSGVAFSVSQE
jgi:hypothetical protein